MKKHRGEKHKIKLGRREYREEYLHSEHWINLRDSVIQKYPNCFLCDDPAVDVHHIRYRNLYNVIPEKDLCSLCRKCHNIVHKFLKLHKIYNKDVLTKAFEIHKSNLGKKIILDEKKINKIKSCSPLQQQRIRGELKITTSVHWERLLNGEISIPLWEKIDGIISSNFLKKVKITKRSEKPNKRSFYY